ncbi:unnamed protein product [Diatraea saccharalis]|uniref:Uncharacterized protein n=1 Tax=Diatraea saccharalis TaxID=40085 RepID=A0A9N9WL56_9NEOP|nr:unnamed protein product [Diatraea saccharalis]
MATNVKWRPTGAFIFVVLMVTNIDCSKDLIEKMSISFLKNVQDCKKELSAPDEVIKSLMKFWEEDADLSHRELGCLILCVASKHELVELDTYKLHHKNAFEYAKKHGADDDTAKKLITLIQGCESQNEGNSDHCHRIREIAKCYHGHMHDLKWAPSMEVIIAELMADM